ncbi:hypothetical protein BC835DRAFT_1304913 [Cytidiella melzeri]|nr:hypothetical protein BC835DRAFT_1304913 [Cytidiella melzeri]
MFLGIISLLKNVEEEMSSIVWECAIVKHAMDNVQVESKRTPAQHAKPARHAHESWFETFKRGQLSHGPSLNLTLASYTRRKFNVATALQSHNDHKASAGTRSDSRVGLNARLCGLRERADVRRQNRHTISPQFGEDYPGDRLAAFDPLKLKVQLSQS